MDEEMKVNSKGQTKRKKVEIDMIAHSKKLKDDAHPSDHPDEPTDGEHVPSGIAWTEDELKQLIARVEAEIPKGDALSYLKRIQKIDWENVKFEPFSKEECRDKCVEILSKLRKFRTLTELIIDAKEWVNKPWTNFQVKKKVNHPDKPSRPLTSYLLFFMEKRPKLAKRYPEMKTIELTQKIGEKFKCLPPEKKQKYIDKALLMKEEYQEKLKAFYELHPEQRELDKPVVAISKKKPNPSGLIRPLPPFKMYCDKKLKDHENDENFDQKAFIVRCKEKWNNLSDKRKFVWIKWAFEKEAEYLEKMRIFQAKNPDQCSLNDFRSVLNKEEKNLYDKMCGKPEKPPKSAYALFASQFLKESNKVDQKEKMKDLSERWKAMPVIEKKEYADRLRSMQERYDSDFASYLETLPEDRKRAELESQKTNVKSKLKPTQKSTTLVNVLENYIERIDKNTSPRKNKVYKDEPIEPPRTVKEYFIQKYMKKNSDTGDNISTTQAKSVWKTLDEKKKLKYKKELCSLKERYIRDYEIFLKKLGEKELQEYSKLKRDQNDVDDTNSDDDDDEDVDNDHESGNSNEGRDDDSSSSSSSSSDSGEELRNSVVPTLPGSLKEYYVQKYIKEHPGVSQGYSKSQALSNWENLSEKKKLKCKKEFDELRRNTEEQTTKKKIASYINQKKSQPNSVPGVGGRANSDSSSDDSDDSDLKPGQKNLKLVKSIAKKSSPVKKKEVRMNPPSSSDSDSSD